MKNKIIFSLFIIFKNSNNYLLVYHPKKDIETKIKVLFET